MPDKFQHISTLLDSSRNMKILGEATFGIIRSLRSRTPSAQFELDLLGESELSVSHF